MKIPPTLLWRFSLSWVVALVVALAALSTLSSGRSYIQRSQRRAQKEIGQIERGIAQYRRKTGAPPRSLGQLSALSDVFVAVESDNTVRDPWRRPYFYSVQDGKPRVLSLGEDGAPGGVGLDCDINSAPQLPRQAEPTLWQVAAHPASRGILLCALCCGVLTFGVAWAGLREDRLVDGSLLEIITPLLLTTLFAGFVAMMITALHVPSGH